MKLTISQVVSMNDALKELSNTPLPAGLSDNVASILVQAAEILQSASVRHIDLYRQFGVLSDDGARTVIPDENVAAFSEGNRVIVSEEVEIDTAGITFESFEDTLVKPSVLLALAPLLTRGT